MSDEEREFKEKLDSYKIEKCKNDEDFDIEMWDFETKTCKHELASKYSEKIADLQKRFTAEDNRWQKIFRAEERKRNKLIAFYQKMKSCDAIPPWAVKFPDELISKAISDYKDDRDRTIWENKVKIAGIKFILENKGLPRDYRKRHYDEQWILEKLIKKKPNDLRQMLAKLENVIENTDYERFYLASELPATEREKLVKKYGYRIVPFMNIETGKTGVNAVILNDTRKESDYHFCMKHLFAKTFGGKVEFGHDERVDVMFTDGSKYIAIEIETGSNKDIQIERKVEFLKKRFNNYLIVCKRELKRRYRLFTTDEHIATMTEAAAFVRKFMNL